MLVVDACNLERNLVLVGQMLTSPHRIVVALNMVDLAARRHLTIDAQALSRRLGVPVVPIVARKAQGIEALRAALSTATPFGRLKVPGASPSVPNARTGLPSGSNTTMQSWCRRPDGPVLFLM